jgi:hypothetical protein
MKASIKIILVIVGLLVLLLGAVGGALGLFLPDDVEVTGTGDDPVPVEDRLADGVWFGYVTVDGDGDTVTLGIDIAQILTGQAARDAAVDAGAIGADEELPNDIFILDDDTRVYKHTLDESAVVRVLDGNQPWIQLDVTPSGLLALYDGTYAGTPVYGISPGTPIPMNVTVAGGVVAAAEAVYLP